MALSPAKCRLSCLIFLDGLHHNGLANDQPSSSSSSGENRSRILFDQYRQAVINILDNNNNNSVPGLAFRHQTPFMELKLAELQKVASLQAQLQFYQEAGVKMSIFMGCNNGEIELGFSNETQVDLEMKVKLAVGGLLPIEFQRRSLQHLGSALSSSSIPVETTSSPCAQTIQALNRIRNARLPNIESENDVLTKALLAVITSSSSQQKMPPNYHVHVQPNDEASAFRRYNDVGSTLMPTIARTRMSNMFKRAIMFYRGVQRRVPRSTLHMMKERRRRERMNENFRALRSLLPPGTKNVKASMLASTRDYLSSLKAQVAELAERNQLLEAQLLLPHQEKPILSSNERVVVRIVAVDESTSSEGRTVDLQVAVLMGQPFRMLDLATCVLEYLKEVNNVSVMSIEANTRILIEPTSSNSISVRLRIQGDDLDNSGFQEAIRRVVADLASKTHLELIHT